MTTHPNGAHTEDQRTTGPQRQDRRQGASVAPIRMIFRVVPIALLVCLVMLLVGAFIPDTAYGHWTEPGRDFLLSIYSAGGPPPHFG